MITRGLLDIGFIKMRTRIEQILFFINRIPDNTYPGVYLKERENDFLSGEYWWREMWHFLGGALLSVPLVWSDFVKYMPFIVMALATLKELLLDLHEQEDGIHWKNIIDILAWTLGSILVVSIRGF